MENPKSGGGNLKMRIKLVYGEERINVISAYAPQAGSDETEKEVFWRDLDEVQGEVPKEERCIVGGDLNGHIGQDNEGVRRVHGGKGMGARNQEGESIVSFAIAFDMAILNTFYTKRNYRTYKSGPREGKASTWR